MKLFQFQETGSSSISEGEGEDESLFYSTTTQMAVQVVFFMYFLEQL